MENMHPKVAEASEKWSEVKFYNFDDINPKELDGGILRKEVTLGRTMLVWFRLPAGLATDPEHFHPHEQISYIVSGEVEATIGGKTERCGPGGGYLVAPNVKHHIRVLSECVCIDAFAPPREDYL